MKNGMEASQLRNWKIKNELIFFYIISNLLIAINCLVGAFLPYRFVHAGYALTLIIGEHTQFSMFAVGNRVRMALI